MSRLSFCILENYNCNQNTLAYYCDVFSLLILEPNCTMYIFFLGLIHNIACK